MAYGMRIWGADGALQLDENSFTFRVVLSVVVANSGWTITDSSKGFGYKDFAVPGATPSNAAATVIPIGAYAENTTQFETEMLNGVVRVYNYNRGFTAGAWIANATSMRLLVMRFA
jgi:hypothetical protein